MPWEERYYRRLTALLVKLDMITYDQEWALDHSVAIFFSRDN